MGKQVECKLGDPVIRLNKLCASQYYRMGTHERDSDPRETFFFLRYIFFFH